MPNKRFRAVIVVVLGLFPLSMVGAQESVDPTKDLQHDIQTLGNILGAPPDYFAQYTPPEIRIVPEEEFNAMVAKMAKEANSDFVENGSLLGAYAHPECDGDRQTLIEISTIYIRIAESLKPPMPAWDYFRILRMHELYHWAVCKVVGEDRFFVPEGERAWSREEAYARSIERLFAREQLGSVAALPSDYLFGPRVSDMPVEKLPDPMLKLMPWRVSEVGGDTGLIKWDTKSGGILFVRILVATALVSSGPPNPYFKEFETQHLPGYRAAAESTDLYYYNAIMHHGNYVGFEKFLITEDGAKGVVMRDNFKRTAAWWDAGYVPTGQDGLGPAPDNPGYVGRWIQVYPVAVKKN